jgi:hypothetical protein
MSLEKVRDRLGNCARRKKIEETETEGTAWSEAGFWPGKM